MVSNFKRLFDFNSIPPYQSFFLFGARGTGKSTLVREYLKLNQYFNITYDLLKNDDFLKLQSRPSLIRQEVEAALKKHGAFTLSLNPSPHEGEEQNARKDLSILQVHIDEVQKIPPLLDEVHYLIEAYPQKVRFILSGSSARKLKRGGANLLAGRAWEKTLYPLTSIEMGEDFSLPKALQYGTLPKATFGNEIEKKEFLKAYVGTYLREEIQAESLVRRLDHFHRFLEAVAKVNTELVNLSNISQEAMIPRKTVSSYYEILEDTLMGFFLQPWGHHLRRKDIVSHGKFYFFDVGVANALNQNLFWPPPPGSPVFGNIFENFCVTEFIRLHRYKGTEHKLGFYRTHSGTEVDIIEEKGSNLRAIEIKSAQTPTKKDISGLFHFATHFPKAELVVICNTSRPYTIGPVTCYPWKDFFSEEMKK